MNSKDNSSNHEEIKVNTLDFLLEEIHKSDAINLDILEMGQENAFNIKEENYINEDDDQFERKLLESEELDRKILDWESKKVGQENDLNIKREKDINEDNDELEKKLVESEALDRKILDWESKKLHTTCEYCNKWMLKTSCK